jgi:hypothetical protein
MPMTSSAKLKLKSIPSTCWVRKPHIIGNQKVHAEFAIDAGEKIQIEGGSHTDMVVIRVNQGLNGLEHVGAEEERVTRLESLAR